LGDEKRVAIVKGLSVVEELKDNSLNPKSGRVMDETVFLVPRSSPVNHQTLSKLLAKNDLDFFYSICGGKEALIYEKIVVSFFIRKILRKQESWNYSVYLLETDKEGVSSELTLSEGNSTTLALYLSLLSAYYKEPISKEVVATATVEIGKCSEFRCVQCFQEKELTKNAEENFNKNKVKSVGGLKHKITAAVRAGAKRLIMATEQKENYEATVPSETREKLTVYYVKNVEELEELFWRGEFS
jgi:hypothetical protein